MKSYTRTAIFTATFDSNSPNRGTVEFFQDCRTCFLFLPVERF